MSECNSILLTKEQLSHLHDLEKLYDASLEVKDLYGEVQVVFTSEKFTHSNDLYAVGVRFNPNYFEVNLRELEAEMKALTSHLK